MKDLFNSDLSKSIIKVNRMTFNLEDLNFKSKKTLTIHMIAHKLLDIFQYHIGNENSIGREELFLKIFDVQENTEDVKDWVKWEMVKRAMRLVRQKTKIFIGLKVVNKTWRYFVVISHDDAQLYCDRLDKAIFAMKKAQYKARTAVTENWALDRENWKLPNYIKQPKIE